jgi:hypothetical protein
LSYLLDTNTVSELAKERPSLAVVNWLQRHHHECFLSSVTIGELVKGLEMLPEGKKRRRLTRDSDSCSRTTATAFFPTMNSAPLNGAGCMLPQKSKIDRCRWKIVSSKQLH